MFAKCTPLILQKAQMLLTTTQQEFLLKWSTMHADVHF